MRPVDVDTLLRIARQLNKLDVPYCFTGGVVIVFLLDNPRLVTVRPTDDVDVITSVVTRIAYTHLEEKIRGLGFSHDTSEGAPSCRWIYEGTKVDIMPAKDPTGQFSDRWFEYALSSAEDRVIGDLTIRIISATAFVATKLAAFHDRGDNDFYHHDLEDVLTIIDGRQSFVTELKKEDAALCEFVALNIQTLISNPRFRDALPGHLESDDASQARLPILSAKLSDISALASQPA